jgi:hypothetical protein
LCVSDSEVILATLLAYPLVSRSDLRECIKIKHRTSPAKKNEPGDQDIYSWGVVMHRPGDRIKLKDLQSVYVCVEWMQVEDVCVK